MKQKVRRDTSTTIDADAASIVLPASLLGREAGLIEYMAGELLLLSGNSFSDAICTNCAATEAT